MKMTYSNGDLGCIEFCSFFRESSRCSEMHEKFTTSHKSHDEENLWLSLKYVVHTNKEWVISLHEDLFLKFSALYLVIIENDIFSQRFHSKNLFGILFLDKEHLTEASSTNNPSDDEVL